MTGITKGQATAILTGTELGGHADKSYRVCLAVPNSLLGISHGNNNSGFSFGVVQLDIANNNFAQTAYGQILDLALAARQITQAQHDHLATYTGIPRPDLNAATSGVYAADKALLNTLFATPAAHQAVNDQTNDYLASSLVPTVNKLLDAMAAKCGSSSVFDPGNPDHSLAYAAVTSMANRFGDLAGSTTFFLANLPNDISVVKNRFLSLFQPSDWELIQTGAAMLQDYDAANPAG